jgi:5S rRNA maturation endonuclease (ribonuclease M5)
MISELKKYYDMILRRGNEINGVIKRNLKEIYHQLVQNYAYKTLKEQGVIKGVKFVF